MSAILASAVILGWIATGIAWSRPRRRGPFARAAGLLARLAGISVTARTIERSAEASGAAACAAGDGKAGTREVKLARLFTQSGLDADGRPVMDPGSSSYAFTFDGKDAFAGLVEAEYARRGGKHFRQVVALGDGAARI